MDTSETYIKMCQKAVEIQKEWKVEKGDWYILVEEKIDKCVNSIKKGVPECVGLITFPYNEEEIGILDGYDDRDFFKRTDFVWLPRQDQLQEMINVPDKVNLLYRLVEYADGWSCSWEQLWLVFVVHEKYHKKWNGENWIPE